MTNLDLAGYNLESLETTFVVTKLLPNGNQQIIEADTDQTNAEELRRQHEERDTTSHFRVHRVGLELRELSRTVRPGEARFQVASREEGGRTQWAVVPTGKTPTNPDFAWGMNQEGAEVMCDLVNKLPEGYKALYRRDISQYRNEAAQAGIEVYIEEPGEKEWAVKRPLDKVEWLLRDADAHAAKAPERAAARAKREREETEAAAAEKAERAWVRLHGPRITPEQESYVVDLIAQLADAGGAGTVQGPMDVAKIHDLTKLEASVYIDNLKAQIETLRRAAAEEKFKVVEKGEGE